MVVKAQIMDENAIRRAIVRISHEIIEKNNGVTTSFWSVLRREACRWQKEYAPA